MKQQTNWDFNNFTLTRLVLGPWQVNSYVLTRKNTRECWIVDPSFEPAPLLTFLKQEKLAPKAILLTHGHLDHIAGVPDILEAFPDTPVFIDPADSSCLSDPMLNLSGLSGMDIRIDCQPLPLKEGEVTSFIEGELKILPLPGHSPGGAGLYLPQENLLLSGDVLFKDSIGRFDFPTSSAEDLRKSIESLKNLPKETLVFPGHGPETQMKRELTRNPYLAEGF